MIKKAFKNNISRISAVGQGMGVGGNRARYEVYGHSNEKALRMGIDLGMTFIDTAEEYGFGESERIVARAIKGVRNKVFLATKASSEHLSFEKVIRAAENSLKRLKTDYIDLYQVHWPNPTVSIMETMSAMCKLLVSGKIRYVGVCNFSLSEIKRVKKVIPEEKFISVQAEYNLFDRTIEQQILPYCEKNNLLVIAYSPLDQGKIVEGEKRVNCIQKIARKYRKTPAQIALNWVISHNSVVAVCQSKTPKHIIENAHVEMFKLSNDDIQKINRICKISLKNVFPETIQVCGKKKGIRVYKTIEEARENRFAFKPSPEELANEIRSGEILKPFKVRKLIGYKNKYKYELIEGRLRFWAWVIANGMDGTVPVLIRNRL
jgi:diketogulonate reductase-like aldo/keto reductase